MNANLNVIPEVRRARCEATDLRALLSGTQDRTLSAWPWVPDRKLRQRSLRDRASLASGMTEFAETTVTA
jgi:hypothetical protein